MSKTGRDFEHAVWMLFQSVPTLSIQDIQYIIDPGTPDERIFVELDEGYQLGLFSFLLSQKYQKEPGIFEQIGNWHFYQGQEPLPMTLWLDALNPTTNVSLALETSSTSPWDTGGERFKPPTSCSLSKRRSKRR